ncbi:Cupin domain-containing protein [Filimonas lacunae]|uniref:Cupin domain-containing protein n=1 Tax=Filimonas lacunae TaxID=477680 RepID=A0A173MMY4_9BACT|nr:cupin domain-containing protein [Filimonas lacunae]BAV08846.1 pectin degradation protein KdgF [Filimonas lacunae]SIS62687.1 Cupin domain-containing protein [Filimonas lacunae]
MSNNTNKQVFIEDSTIGWEVTGEGVKRKIMSYDERVMLVKVVFQKGAIGTLHHHYHTQITHIDSGVFEVEVDGVKKVLNAGDAFYIPPNAVHGVVCLEAGMLVDIFSPMREDFIQQ